MHLFHDALVSFAERWDISMSVSAVFVIGVVLCLRIILRKAPKQYAYILWMLVFFRLLCPFTIESAFSIIPVKGDAVVYQTAEDGGKIKVNTGIDTVDMLVTRGIEEGNELFNHQNAEELYEFEAMSTEKETGFLDKIFASLWVVWIIGIILILAVNIIQMARLRWKLRTATKVDVQIQDNSREKWICPIYESEYIHTAFLLGIFRPRIYLPLGIEEERGYVIAHEMMHKKRLDYVIKPICYLAVIIHWFNPLVWLSFYLMTKDMEMSCDEQVLKSAIGDIRGEYSRSLLNVSIKRSSLSVPLAFGEGNTKDRIKHALKYKKPSTWIGIAAIVVLLVAAITLLPNASSEGNLLSKQGKDEQDDFISGENQDTEEFFQELSKNRNLYIGDAGANGKLLRLLPGLDGYESKGTRLHTDKEPYQMDILYEKSEPLSVRQEQENRAIMARNAVFLFATIENMDVCSYCLDNDGVLEQTSFTRAEIEELFGVLYEKSETPEGLMELEAEMQAYKEKWRKCWTAP